MRSWNDFCADFDVENLPNEPLQVAAAKVSYFSQIVGLFPILEGRAFPCDETSRSADCWQDQFLHVQSVLGLKGNISRVFALLFSQRIGS
jgi:hypothetical protein